jgi:hypothetical protein
MRAYTLEKWYLDALTQDETFVFAYLAIIRFLGSTYAQFSVNLARPGEPGITRSFTLKPKDYVPGLALTRLNTSNGELEIGAGLCRLRMAFPNVEVQLDHTCSAPFDFGRQPLTIRRDRRHQVDWHPVILDARVSGRIRLDAEQIELNGCPGYCDYLWSNVLPPQNPVKELHWGRIHAPGCSLTYTHAQGSSGRWSRLYARLNDASIVMDDLHLTTQGAIPSPSLGLTYPGRVDLQAKNEASQVSAQLKHSAIAIEAGFMDDVGAGLFSGLVRSVTKDPRGSKLFARADVLLEHQGARLELSDVPCIDEYVRFGR